jgi:choice-of-anchor B domain-containing protein
MRFLVFLTVFFISKIVGAQNFNLELLGQVNYQQLHNTNLNDVWGYVDEEGNEYALVGAAKGVSIVNVSDPTNPIEVYWHPGSESVWRDLKTFGDYAYITTEASSGLLIIDLSPLPNGTITQSTNYTGGLGSQWQSAHNLWIDEEGFCYIFGANRGSGGVIILDLNIDPMNPVEVGVFDDWYVHDGYARDNLLYLAHIYEGMISVLDVTDKSNPVLLGTSPTPSNFAHNVWPSDDGNFVFTTDEVSGGFIGAYDVSNPADIFETDRTRSNPQHGTVPHNVHVLGDYLITSYYADGVTIHDISDPYNLILVGVYDTYPGNSTSTIGCWGAYPFLPSGNILATDIGNGLFILGPTYVEAARLEGTVTNAVTGQQIPGVSILIENDVQVELTASNGYYRTGYYDSGNYDVEYSRYAYESQLISTNLINGTTLLQDVELVPLDDFQFIVKVLNHLGQPMLNADVRLDHLSAGVKTDLVSNGLGDAEFTLFYEDEYEVTVGRWGWITQCVTVSIDETTQEIVVQLEKGFYDDFSFDFGWSTFGDASAGLWVRDIPIGFDIGGGVNSNPHIDSPNDCGEYAYITGNDGGPDNVTGGTVTLISPVFDVTDYSDPFVYYERWFFNFLGPNPPDDTLRILLSNGLTTVEIDKQGSDNTILDTWVPVQYRISDYLLPTATMQLFVTTSDFSSSPNVTEAGFDHFRVSEGFFVSIDEELALSKEIHVYPNPATEWLYIEGVLNGEHIRLLDFQGRVVNEWIADSNLMKLNLLHYVPGMYLIQVSNHSYKFVKN